MRTYDTLLANVNDGTAIVTINREEKLNALNGQTLTELSLLLDDLQQDINVRGVIVTGSGSKSFVAGADILEFKGLSADEAKELATKGHVEVMDKIAHFSKPIIAAVNGFALGGGLEIAMACHIRVASTNAKFGLPEVSLGLIPGYGGTQRLTALVGRGKALEMIMTGDMIVAEDAFQWGLINYVVSQEELIVKCIDILQRIYLRSLTAVSSAIIAVNEGLVNPSNGFKKEIELFGECFLQEDSKEGIEAFIEKRKPNF